MLVDSTYEIGNRLYKIRKKRGMTQCEVAERAGLSDRTYADIERGSTNMRVETALRICLALQITPDEMLIKESGSEPIEMSQIVARLEVCSQKEQQTALQLLSVYLNSLS